MLFDCGHDFFIKLENHFRKSSTLHCSLTSAVNCFSIKWKIHNVSVTGNVVGKSVTPRESRLQILRTYHNSNCGMVFPGHANINRHLVCKGPTGWKDKLTLTFKNGCKFLKREQGPQLDRQYFTELLNYLLLKDKSKSITTTTHFITGYIKDNWDRKLGNFAQNNLKANRNEWN